MKILYDIFNAEVRREDILKQP